MKKLDFNERKLCQLQGKLFEESLDKTHCSSLIFIRRFMSSNLAKKFDDYSFFVTSLDLNDCFIELENEYGKSSYGKIKYSSDEMFWIGYIYRALAIILKLTSKKVFTLFNAKEIIKYYNIYHTFDIEQACEKMIESINYQIPNVQEYAYRLLKKYLIREKLKKLIGQEVTVYVDNQNAISKKASTSINYGFIKEIITVDNEYQKVITLGKKMDNSEVYKGLVYAIIESEKDLPDKLIVVTKKRRYNLKDINKILSYQKENYKYKVVK